MRQSLIPVLTIVAAIFAIWYAAAVWLNAPWARDVAARNDQSLSVTELVAATWSQEKPKLPAPHQVAVELYDTVIDKKVTSKRSLVYHSGITLSATLLGFALGTALGFALAIGIVYNRVMDKSVMP